MDASLVGPFQSAWKGRRSESTNSSSVKSFSGNRPWTSTLRGACGFQGLLAVAVATRRDVGGMRKATPAFRKRPLPVVGLAGVVGGTPRVPMDLADNA